MYSSSYVARSFLFAAAESARKDFNSFTVQNFHGNITLKI